MNTQITALQERNTAAGALADAAHNLINSAKDRQGFTVINTEAYNSLLTALANYQKTIARTFPAAFAPAPAPIEDLDLLISTTNASIERLRADADAWRRAAQTTTALNSGLQQQLATINTLNNKLTDWIADVPTEAITAIANQSTLPHNPALTAVRAWTQHIIETK